MSVEDKLKELQALAEELNAKDAVEVIEEAKEEDEPKDSNSSSEIETDDSEDVDTEEEKENAKAAPKSNGDKEVKTESTKIDLGALFDGEELSEEFKVKATAVFEAAVATRVKQEVDEATASLEASFAQKALTESTELKESLVDKVDGYLDFMVEQWMKDNELAINRGIKTEILESFVTGMKSVFESHYIDVPDEKYDLVEAAQQEAQKLEERLDEEVAKNVELNRTLKEMNRQTQIGEACEGMAATDKERFRQLAEELTYSEEEFGSKLQAIKESYFKAPVEEETKIIKEEFMTDTPVEVIQEETKAIDPSVAKYLTAIERSGKY
jgi:hypothetical protein